MGDAAQQYIHHPPSRYINFSTQHTRSQTKVNAAATWIVNQLQSSFQIEHPHIATFNAAVVPPLSGPTHRTRVHVDNHVLMDTLLGVDGALQSLMGASITPFVRTVINDISDPILDFPPDFPLPSPCPSSIVKWASQDIDTACTMALLDDDLALLDPDPLPATDAASLPIIDAEGPIKPACYEVALPCINTPVKLAPAVEKPGPNLAASPRVDQAASPRVDQAASPRVDHAASPRVDQAAFHPPKPRQAAMRPKQWIDSSSSDDDDVWQPSRARNASPRTPRPTKRPRITSNSGGSPPPDGKHLTKATLAPLFIYPQEVRCAECVPPRVVCEE